MKWFIFLVHTHGFTLETEIVPRPLDARPALGDPFTPWYQTEEHYDEEHIHIQAPSLADALEKAEEIYQRIKASRP